MRVAVGLRMLDIIKIKEPNLTVSPAYIEAEQLLKKKPDTITYKEKLVLLDRLEALCIVAGLSYGRVLEQAFNENSKTK